MALALAGGCSSGDTEHGSSAASGTGSSTGAGSGSGTTGGGTGTGGQPCVAAEPFPSPLRRMTRLEYNNTVRDLLGSALSPADRFPPDEVSGGFSNNADVLTVSPLLAEKYMEAAEALAAEAVKTLPALLPCDPATGEDACARRFVERFGRRAYRRPLTATDVDRLMRAYAFGRMGGSFAGGIEVAIRAALQSPSFLYRFEFATLPAAGDKVVRLSQHELAARLSYFFWGSMPDAGLDAAADNGELATAEQVAARARAMLDDRRARRAVGEFYRQWLGLGALDTVIKDPQVHPEFDATLRAAMGAETPAFVEHVLWSADRRLSTLFGSSVGFVTPPLASLYGVSVPSAGAPQAVTLDPTQRAGVFTQAGFLAVHALPNQSSPVSRGKFVRELVLCQETLSPPPNLNVTPPEVDPSHSTRERFAQHTVNPACSGCHELMDPIGFGFENYDAIGRFRANEGGKAIDASGFIAHSKDLDGPFRGARELSQKLAQSREVQDCVATQWFRYAFGRFESTGDACSLAQLRDRFTGSGADLKELLVALTQTESFLYRRPLADEVMP